MPAPVPPSLPNFGRGYAQAASQDTPKAKLPTPAAGSQDPLAAIANLKTVISEFTSIFRATLQHNGKPFLLRLIAWITAVIIIMADGSVLRVILVYMSPSGPLVTMTKLLSGGGSELQKLGIDVSNRQCEWENASLRNGYVVTAPT